MSTRPTLIINPRRRSAKLAHCSEHTEAGDRMNYVLSEIEVLLAACTSAERHAFWVEFDRIKARYRKPPELPVFQRLPSQPPQSSHLEHTTAPVEHYQEPDEYQEQHEEVVTRPELPDFLKHRRRGYPRPPAHPRPSPELPSFLNKRAARNWE